MLSRRKFLKRGALFVPATGLVRRAVAQGLGIGDLPFLASGADPCVAILANYTALDTLQNTLSGGCGWAGAGTAAGSAGSPTFQQKTMTAGAQWTLGNVANLLWRRQLSIGNNWNRIRIGAILNVAATANLTKAFQWIGMDNIAHAFFTASGNFIGIQLGGGSAWGFSSGANGYIAPGATDNFGVTVVNIVSSTSGYGVNNTEATLATGHRHMVITDIIKGSPNYTIRRYANQAANPSVDASVADLQTAMAATENANMVISGITYTVQSTTMAFSETNGNLDTVNVIWDSTQGGSELAYIFDVGVKKLA